MKLPLWALLEGEGLTFGALDCVYDMLFQIALCVAKAVINEWDSLFPDYFIQFSSELIIPGLSSQFRQNQMLWEDMSLK